MKTASITIRWGPTCCASELGISAVQETGGWVENPLSPLEGFPERGQTDFGQPQPRWGTQPTIPGGFPRQAIRDHAVTAGLFELPRRHGRTQCSPEFSQAGGVPRDIVHKGITCGSQAGEGATSMFLARGSQGCKPKCPFTKRLHGSEPYGCDTAHHLLLGLSIGLTQVLCLALKHGIPAIRWDCVWIELKPEVAHE